MPTTAKTQPRDDDVAAFLAGIEPPGRRADCEALAALMREVSSEPAQLWGSSMVGFGRYHYRYASGHEGDSFRLGFASRKDAIALYLSCDLAAHAERLQALGPHKTGKGCLYIRRLADVDTTTLRTLMEESMAARPAGDTGGA